MKQLTNCTKKIPTIFLAYSWKDQEHADLLNKDLQNLGVSVIRDTRNPGLIRTIDDFLKGFQKEDYVLMLVSHNYLISESCMKEISCLLEEPGIYSRVLPVIIKDEVEVDGRNFTFDISNQETCTSYVQYWMRRLKRLEEKKSMMEWPSYQSDLTETIIQYKKLIKTIESFLEKLCRQQCTAFYDILQGNYHELFQLIDFQPEDRYCELLHIDKIKSVEHREIALDEFSEKYKITSSWWFMKARIARTENRLIYTEFCLKKVIELNQMHYAAYYELSLIQIENGKLDLAEKLCKNALDINPQYHDARMSYANILCETGRYEEAEREYHQVLRVDPMNSETNYKLGTLYRKQLKEMRKAIIHYERVLESNVNFLEVMNNIALAYTELKEFHRAETIYREAIHRIAATNSKFCNLRDEAIIYNNFATLLLIYIGKTEEAGYYFNLAAEVDQDSFKCMYDFIGFLVGYTNDYDVALKVCKNALAMFVTKEEQIELRYLQVAIYSDTGKKALAKKTARNILELDGDQDMARRMLNMLE